MQDDDGAITHDQAAEQFIGTVDVWTLRQLRWPLMRMLCRAYVEQRELRQYQRRLLATRRWRMLRCVPRADSGDASSAHVFNIYGTAV